MFETFIECDLIFVCFLWGFRCWVSSNDIKTKFVWQVCCQLVFRHQFQVIECLCLATHLTDVKIRLVSVRYSTVATQKGCATQTLPTKSKYSSPTACKTLTYNLTVLALPITGACWLWLKKTRICAAKPGWFWMMRYRLLNAKESLRHSRPIMEIAGNSATVTKLGKRNFQYLCGLIMANRTRSVQQWTEQPEWP